MLKIGGGFCDDEGMEVCNGDERILKEVFLRSAPRNRLMLLNCRLGCDLGSHFPHEFALQPTTTSCNSNDSSQKFLESRLQSRIASVGCKSSWNSGWDQRLCDL
ncbi:hypothetical protein QYF36_014813 [Acer negundo]|nr:hypothetical protein QYF36_014813 [Acer negundo]